MIIIYLIIMMLLGFITYVKFNTILKPNMMINLLWCVLASIASLGIYDTRIPSTLTHVYCISFILIFNLMYIIITRKRTISQIKYSEIQDTYKYKIIYLLNILSWIYMIPILVNAIKIINTLGFESVRNYAFVVSDVLVNSNQKFISQIIIKAIFQSTVLLAMINIALNKKTRFLTLCSIINVIIYTISFGGRFEILQILIYYILANLYIKKIHFNTKRKKISLALIAVFLIAMAVVTNARGSSNLIRSIHAYYIMPFSFLDYILSNPDLFDLNHYLWGSATFGFITEPITLILKAFFGCEIDIASYYINICTQTFYEISPGRYYNALTTIIYPFLRDFGYIGIILGGAFLGSTIAYLENKFSKNKQIKYYCLYIFMVYVVFNSILMYDLLSYGSAFTIIFILIFTTDKRWVFN